MLLPTSLSLLPVETSLCSITVITFQQPSSGSTWWRWWKTKREQCFIFSLACCTEKLHLKYMLVLCAFTVSVCLYQQEHDNSDILISLQLKHIMGIGQEVRYVQMTSIKTPTSFTRRNTESAPHSHKRSRSRLQIKQSFYTPISW